MRKFLLLLVLAYSGQLHAQRQYSKTQYRYSVAYTYSTPMGQFASGNSSRYFAGQCLPASGASFYFGITFHSPFAFGLCISQSPFYASRDKFLTQLRDRYLDPSFYTTINLYDMSYSIGNIALQGSYMFHPGFADIEPYILLGAGFDGADNTGPIYSIHRKLKNDNYAEDIDAQLDRKAFFYPGAGVRINKKIWKVIYATAGVQYNLGTSSYRISETTTDFLGRTSTISRSYTQPVSALQASIGLEVRFRAIRHFKNPPAAQKP